MLQKDGRETSGRRALLDSLFLSSLHRTLICKQYAPPAATCLVTQDLRLASRDRLRNLAEVGSQWVNRSALQEELLVVAGLDGGPDRLEHGLVLDNVQVDTQASLGTVACLIEGATGDGRNKNRFAWLSRVRCGSGGTPPATTGQACR
jgi:hypothetical protein